MAISSTECHSTDINHGAQVKAGGAVVMIAFQLVFLIGCVPGRLIVNFKSGFACFRGAFWGLARGQRFGSAFKKNLIDEVFLCRPSKFFC